MNEKSDDYDVATIRTSLLGKMGEYADDYPDQLEHYFPRILVKIADLWGTSSLDSYLKSLMLPDRHDRHGFPPEVGSEILRLGRINGLISGTPHAGSSGWAIVEESARNEKTTAAKH